MELLNSIYPQAEIWFSGILPRLDDDHKRGLNINEVKLSESGNHRPLWIGPRFSKFFLGDDLELTGFVPWIPNHNRKIKILESEVNVSRNRLNLQIHRFIRIISKRWEIYRQITFQAWFYYFLQWSAFFQWSFRPNPLRRPSERRTPLYSQNKTEKRYSEGHRDDCVHLGDDGNILLQDMVGGLVNHLSDLDKRFDLEDLMNQTVKNSTSRDQGQILILGVGWLAWSRIR